MQRHSLEANQSQVSAHALLRLHVQASWFVQPLIGRMLVASRSVWGSPLTALCTHFLCLLVNEGAAMQGRWCPWTLMARRLSTRGLFQGCPAMSLLKSLPCHFFLTGMANMVQTGNWFSRMVSWALMVLYTRNSSHRGKMQTCFQVMGHFGATACHSWLTSVLVSSAHADVLHTAFPLSPTRCACWPCIRQRVPHTTQLMCWH